MTWTDGPTDGHKVIIPLGWSTISAFGDGKKKRPMHVWRLEMLGVLLLGSGGGGYGLGYRVLGMSSLYIGIACVKNWEWRLFGSGVGYH
jgi:hypothetical protein